MSRLSFKTFCIEHYAEHAGISDTDAYKIMFDKGLLDMLDTEYEDLHGMSWEYLMQMFDEYLGVK
jgi:hypothetical protein